MGCGASRTATVTPQTSSNAISSMAAPGTSPSKADKSKVFPMSPARSIVVSVVPDSPTVDTVSSTAHTPKTASDLRRIQSAVPNAMSSHTFSVSEVKSVNDGLSGGKSRLSVDTTKLFDVQVGDSTSLSPPDGKVEAEGEVRPPALLVSPVSPRKGFSLGEVLSAKAVASRKRRATVESTRLNESLDAEGHKVVNQYTMFETLGNGSYGKVKKCRNMGEGTTFAVKIVKKSILKRKRVGRFGTALDSVKKELAIWKKLDHENVVSLFEIIDDPDKDKLYMVSEFIDGGRIMPDEQEAAPLTETLAQSITKQLLRALEYLHFQKIIHRDIKPGNLLLTKDGQLKVADFGVSYMYDGEDDTVQSSAGTAAFLAPEICSGQGASGKMVDLWATGVTLYMMLTGHVPFIAPTLPEIYDKIKNEAIVIPDGVNPAAADLIMRLLHKDPALRLTTKEAKRHPFLNPGGVPNISKFVSQAFVPIVATEAEVEAAISRISTIQAVVVARRLSLRLLGRTRSSIQSKSERSASMPSLEVDVSSPASDGFGSKCVSADPSTVPPSFIDSADKRQHSGIPLGELGKETVESPQPFQRKLSCPGNGARVVAELILDDNSSIGSPIQAHASPASVLASPPKLTSVEELPEQFVEEDGRRDDGDNNSDEVATDVLPMRAPRRLSTPGSPNTVINLGASSRRMSANTPSRSSPLIPKGLAISSSHVRQHSNLVPHHPQEGAQSPDIVVLSTPTRTPFMKGDSFAPDHAGLVDVSHAFMFQSTSPPTESTD